MKRYIETFHLFYTIQPKSQHFYKISANFGDFYVFFIAYFFIII